MSGMKEQHLSLEQLRRYAADALSGPERENVEWELSLCEECLRRFMMVLDEDDVTEKLGMPDMAALEERVVAALLHTNAEPGQAAGPVAEAAAAPDAGPSPAAALPCSTEQPRVEPVVAGAAAAFDAGPSPAAALPAAKPARRRKGDAPCEKKPARQRSSWLQHPAAQYAIAASITMFLLSTGVVTGFSDKLMKLDERVLDDPPFTAEEAWRMQPSWSDRIIARTGHWLDALQASRFE